MAGETGPNDPGGLVPREKVRELQRRLWAGAKRAPGRRFHALFDQICRGDVLREAWERVRRNRGAAGVDSQSIRDVEHVVILMQENRSFNHYFGTMRGVRGFGDRITIPQESGKSVWLQSDGTRDIPPYHLDPATNRALLIPSTPHSYADAQAIAKDIIDRYVTDGIDVVHLAYANFRSTLVQEPTVDQIIPVAPRAVDDRATGPASLAAVEYEPDEEDILNDLIPRNVAVQIYRAMLENHAGFYGSQMTAMDNATRNAGDMIKKLGIIYNRQRQAAITTELVEIISGAEAL